MNFLRYRETKAPGFGIPELLFIDDKRGIKINRENIAFLIKMWYSQCEAEIWKDVRGGVRVGFDRSISLCFTFLKERD